MATLSDKEKLRTTWNKGGWEDTEECFDKYDVKDFIRKLKKELMKYDDVPDGQGKNFIDIGTDNLMNIINNLAGPALYVEAKE